MKMVCPACGALMSLDVVIAHEGAREAVQMALHLPAPVGKLLIQYLALFRPPKRQLTLDRMARLLEEILPMIQDGQIRRAGRVWAAPQELWQAALQEILDRDRGHPFKRPLKSHGYLLEILASLANRAEASREAAHEERRRTAPEGKRTGPAEVSAHLERLKGAIK
ncbi:MAG TPA: hypothetical protein VNL74_03900 [Methylococcus sp.]|nr:hypothetical protein [Methylococcus sp.]